MTRTERDEEIEYRITERLAISCGDKVPTKSERIKAEKETENDMKKLEFDKVIEGWKR